MNTKLQKKLSLLPACPGVYLHKSKSGEVIYVGKAAVLKNRVRQYFQSSRDFDKKTEILVSEIFDTNWIETESEIDALFLESELVKRYKPKYNVLLRDDKSQIYIRINMKDDKPFVSYTRNPLDDGAEYYGPYFNSFVLKKAMRFLRRVFPYYVSKPEGQNRIDLDVHLGLSPMPEISSSEYKKSLRQLISYIKGDKKEIIYQLESDMKKSAKLKDFEKASVLRDKIFILKELNQKIMFGDKESLDISKDQALSDIAKLFGLSKPPKRIEGYDISHMSGTNVVASMVVFTNGVSNRKEYRKFKTLNQQNNDFANMSEIIIRRFSEKNIKEWSIPDFILIDGGKGQLGAAIKSLEERNIQIPVIGLAKKQEQIIVSIAKSNVLVDQHYLTEMSGYSANSENYLIINLDKNSHISKLLQRIRDESHRFAVSYHTVLKVARQNQSILSEIPGIGTQTQRKLMKKYGSINAIKKASPDELEKLIGKDKSIRLLDILLKQKT